MSYIVMPIIWFLFSQNDKSSYLIKVYHANATITVPVVASPN